MKTKVTLKEFKLNSHIPAPLIRAVVRQYGTFEEFKLVANDISNHGASGGFSGFIYYEETVLFTDRNKTVILQLLDQQADDFGFKSGLELIQSFNGYDTDITLALLSRLLYGPKKGLSEEQVGDRVQVYNLLAFYALEEVARSLSDLLDNQ